MSREVIPSPYSGQEAESGAIVVSTAKSSCIKNRAIDALRRDREAHRHNTIWTKDSHGGPYRKVREGARLAGLVNDHIDCRVFDVNLQANPKNGYDPLLQKPDGTLVEVRNSIVTDCLWQMLQAEFALHCRPSLAFIKWRLGLLQISSAIT